jgi:prephenate dehydrogenase
MWTPILLQNRENVLHVMDTYTGMLEAFRKAIDESDEEALRKLIQDANRIKRIIR